MPGQEKIVISAHSLPKVLLIPFVIICASPENEYFSVSCFMDSDKEKCPECCGEDTAALSEPHLAERFTAFICTPPFYSSYSLEPSSGQKIH